MINSDATIKYRTLLLIVFINFIVQSTIVQGFRIYGIVANYTLILVLLVTIIYGFNSGLFTAIIGGLLVDSFLGMVIGLNMFILVIIVVLISIIGRPLFTGNKLTLVFMTGVSTLIYHLIYFFFMYFLNKGITFSSILTKTIPIEIVLNSIVCVIFYKIVIKWIERYKLN